jgi:tetratricopeptide (TPR) repeat protein
VSATAPIDPTAFVQTVQPVLARKDPCLLVGVVRDRWTNEQIASLLRCRCMDARKIAALTLSLIGDRSALRKLQTALKDPDPVLNQMVEHAMWSIWFRCGSPEANQLVARGSQSINERDCETALALFNEAIRISPRFAEAYNQRGIAHFLMDRYALSVEDCRRATTLMPCHFGAWAGMGHCYTQLGRLKRAMQCYQKAVEINPHMGEVRDTIAVLQGDAPSA